MQKTWSVEMEDKFKSTLLLLNASVQQQYLQTSKQCEELLLLLQYIEDCEKAQISAKHAKELLEKRKRIEEEKFQRALRIAIERARNVRKQIQDEEACESKKTESNVCSGSNAVDERKKAKSFSMSDTEASCSEMDSLKHNMILGTLKLGIPSKLKALMAEFEHKTADKPMHHVRARFVRHLTWHTRRLNGTDNVETTHQDLVDYLAMAIQHVTVFLQTKFDSMAFRNAFRADRVSKVYPTYQRLEQAKILSKELGAQMRAFGNRNARRPVMSTVAQDHLEKQLAKIRRCEDTVPDHDESQLLFSHLQANGILAQESKHQVLEKLQSFGVFDRSGSCVTNLDSENVPLTGIDDLIAKEVGQAVYDLLISTKVKVNECATTLQSETNRRNVLLICQLADSLIGCKGRRIRSLIEKTQSNIDIC